MNKLIIISGDLATGKTTFSKIISEELKIPVFNKDYLKERLADTIGFKDRLENLKLSKASFSFMEYIFQVLGKQGLDFILEANFKTKEVEALNYLMKEYNYKILTVVFYGDDEILYDRFINRVNNENRHPCHISGNLGNKEVFIEYLKQGRTVKYCEPVIRINCNDFKNIDIQKIIDEYNKL